MEKNYYEVLGISRNATKAEIRRAYLKRVFEVHPDRNPNEPNATEKLKDATEAYAVLSGTAKRVSPQKDRDAVRTEDIRSKINEEPELEVLYKAGNDIEKLFRIANDWRYNAATHNEAILRILKLATREHLDVLISIASDFGFDDKNRTKVGLKAVELASTVEELDKILLNYGLTRRNLTVEVETAARAKLKNIIDMQPAMPDVVSKNTKQDMVDLVEKDNKSKKIFRILIGKIRRKDKDSGPKTLMTS